MVWPAYQGVVMLFTVTGGIRVRVTVLVGAGVPVGSVTITTSVHCVVTPDGGMYVTVVPVLDENVPWSLRSDKQVEPVLPVVQVNGGVPL